MSGSRLSPLQERLLALLADVDPPWTLTGGAALVGVYTRHRTTRDIDLVWYEANSVAEGALAVEERLSTAGLDYSVLQTHPQFVRLRVADSSETVMVDLVAEPTPPVDDIGTATVGGHLIRLNSPHEILVSKLCALLGRAELRDLVDVRAMLESGADLSRALTDAPLKDGGFSPLTLAWVLEGLRVNQLGRVEGWDESEIARLEEFRHALIEDLLSAAAPD
jgi:hypothetical protein